MANEVFPNYAQRAGVSERPDLFVEPGVSALVRVAASLRAAVTVNTFFCDIAEFQPVITSSYPFAMVSFRSDTGWRRDNHAAANWNVIKNSSKIQVALTYVVYIPGQNANILSRLKSLFGSKCPTKLAVMIDMESGSGFAGAGNHSADANELVKLLTAWTGSSKKVVAYANRYDFISNWPGLSSSVKRITASYGGSDPRSWGWQYYGGMSQYGSLAGYPRSAAPFGSWVDMNVIHRSITQVKLDLGITVPQPAPKPTPKPTPKPVPKPAPKEDDEVTYVQFPNDKSTANACYAVYSWNGGSELLWISASEYADLGKPLVRQIHDQAASNIYKLAVVANTLDPRKK